MPAHRTRLAVIDCDCATRRRPHGTAHTYNVHHCGCDACRTAFRRDAAERAAEPRLLPIEPTRDRLALLLERGHTLRSIAQVLGYHYNTIVDLRRSSRTKVRRELAEDITSLPLPPERAVRRCEVDGCRRVHKAHGMCHMHLQRAERAARLEAVAA